MVRQENFGKTGNFYGWADLAGSRQLTAFSDQLSAFSFQPSGKLENRPRNVECPGSLPPWIGHSPFLVRFSMFPDG
jgi:hypothetical protein